MRFPRQLLAANLVVALLAYAGLVVVVALIVLGIAIFGEVTGSAWEKAALAPRWYALFFGVALVNTFLPLYVAHGQTRRQFGTQATAAVLLFTPIAAALITLGYLAEAGIYQLTGWEQALGRTHLFAGPLDLHLVFLEHLLEFLVWTIAGALIMAGFYRSPGAGLLTLPVAIGLILVAQSAIGIESGLPIFGQFLTTNGPQPLGPTIGIALGCAAVGLASTWAVLRDVPLKNQAA